MMSLISDLPLIRNNKMIPPQKFNHFIVQNQKDQTSSFFTVYFIQIIYKRLLMKKATQKIALKKNNRRQFIQRFKTEVRDSNSIENLRISKINESCYKIYKNISKSPQKNHVVECNPKQKSSHSSKKKQFDCISNLEQFKLNSSSRNQDYLHSDEKWLQQCQNGLLKTCGNLQKQIQRKLDQIYKAIKQKVNQMQRLSELINEKDLQVKKLEELNDSVTAVHCIFKNTIRLNNHFRFQLETYNINLILKSLLQTIEVNWGMHTINQSSWAKEKRMAQQLNLISISQPTQTKCKAESNNQDYPISAFCKFLRTEVDQINQSSFNDNLASASSFKIQNQNIHEQEFLNIYLSNNNSKVSLNSSDNCRNKQTQSIKPQHELQYRILSKQHNFNEDKPKIKLHEKVQQNHNQSKRINKDVNLKYKKSSQITKPQLQSKKSGRNGYFSVCSLLKCEQIPKLTESQLEDSQSKRQVLNQVISMLNNKYNKCIKFQ